MDLPQEALLFRKKNFNSLKLLFTQESLFYKDKINFSPLKKITLNRNLLNFFHLRHSSALHQQHIHKNRLHLRRALHLRKLFQIIISFFHRHPLMRSQKLKTQI